MIDELILEAYDWGSRRGLHNTLDLRPQLIKLMEELGELAQGVAKNNDQQILDSIGDMLVVMTQFGAVHANKLNASGEDYLRHCLLLAMNEIRHRKGATVNGVFIKEETPDD